MKTKIKLVTLGLRGYGGVRGLPGFGLFTSAGRSLKRGFSTSGNSNTKPVVIYDNADTQKELIMKDNRGKAGVYRWTNKINGKSYIGSSTNLARRFGVYYNYHNLVDPKRNMPINKAILKYGYSNFKLEIIEYCEPSQVLLREQYYLDLFKPEYNILKIAGSILGYKHTTETLIKLSTAKKGANHPLFGKVVSQTTREKSRMSQGTSAIVLDKETNETKIYLSIRQAAKELSTTDTTVRKYIESGKLYKGRYAITKEFAK